MNKNVERLSHMIAGAKNHGVCQIEKNRSRVITIPTGDDIRMAESIESLNITWQDKVKLASKV